MENSAPFCQCTNQHLLIVNGFCEICMGSTGEGESHNQKHSDKYSHDYFEALELYLEATPNAA